jgi:hypothetical protein
MVRSDLIFVLSVVPDSRTRGFDDFIISLHIYAIKTFLFDDINLFPKKESNPFPMTINFSKKSPISIKMSNYETLRSLRRLLENLSNQAKKTQNRYQ